VGSSGNSTGPHLHFEVHDSSGKIIDPFSGACNDFNTDSWWISQKPYNNQGINHVATNKHIVDFSTCPNQENTNESDFFVPGDSIYFFTYFRDIDTLDWIYTTVYKPDNSVWGYYNFQHKLPFYVEGYHYISGKIANNAPTGMWNFEIIYKGVTYNHNFYVQTNAFVDAVYDEQNDIKVFPNPVKNGLNIHFDNIEKYEYVNFSLNDILGKVTLEKCINSIESTINCRGLKQGIYFYNFEKGNKILKKGKLIIE
jgi:hypothetical protein